MITVNKPGMLVITSTETLAYSVALACQPWLHIDHVYLRPQLYLRYAGRDNWQWNTRSKAYGKIHMQRKFRVISSEQDNRNSLLRFKVLSARGVRKAVSAWTESTYNSCLVAILNRDITDTKGSAAICWCISSSGWIKIQISPEVS